MEDIRIDFATGGLHGSRVQQSEKRLMHLQSVFHDRQAISSMDGDQVIYRVQYFMPVAEGMDGGLFWGNTTLAAGKVGDEYFMTKGHFHAIRNRAEYYATVAGSGALLLMGEDGITHAKKMHPGSLHYIPFNTAHRVANIGNEPLIFLACWPSDAGHDYDTIEREGFTARMLEVNGKPQLVPGSRR